MRTCRKTKCKVQLLLQPILKDINNPVNQSKLEEDDVREARENLCKRVTIVLGNDEMVRIYKPIANLQNKFDFRPPKETPLKLSYLKAFPITLQISIT